jgi:hypothetical protein
MRTLGYVATMLAVLSGTAAADPRSTTIGGVRIDIDAKLPVTLVDEPTGAVVRAPNMPPIWFSAYGEACPATDRPLDLQRPPGFYVAARPPAVSPWPQRVSWDALCVEGDDVTLHVLVQYFDPVAAPAANTYVQDVLRSIVTSLRPPLEIAPKVRLERTKWGPLLRRGPAAKQFLFEGRSLEISLDLASCRSLGATPGILQECRELPDRAIVVSYREPTPPPGEPPPPPPGEPPPPPALPPGEPPPGEPPPPPLTPATPPSSFDQLVQDILLAVVNVYGSASWLPNYPFRPSWANSEIALSKLPPGTWKISDRGTTFELHEIESRSRIIVAQASCAGFWASPPAGTRIAAPSFLPPGTRAAVVDERERWVGASCFSLLGAEVAVTIDLPHAPDPLTARALASALTEVVNATRFSGSIAGAVGRGSLGLFFEGWLVGRFSTIGQIEVIDPGTDAEGKLESIRFAAGFGPGFSRPRFRAALHAGIGLEKAPMKQRDGEDHTGGSLFIDGRAIAGVGPLVVQGIARGTFYFDIDCTESHDKDQLCGDSDHSDHTPRLGWELEGRVGITPRRKGWMMGGYLGVRYFAVWTGDRVENGAVGTLGFLAW